jgi:hypothetical protein
LNILSPHNPSAAHIEEGRSTMGLSKIIGKIGILLFLVLYLAEFTEYKIPQLLAFSYPIIGLFLLVRAITARELPFNRDDLKPVMIIMLMFAMFMLKDYVYKKDIMFYQFIVRTLAPFVVFWLFMGFGKKSKNNAVFLTKSLAIFLFASFVFMVYGKVFLSSSSFNHVRYVLYAHYIDDVMAANEATSIDTLYTQALLAGLCQRAYIFGYQIAGGVTLLVCLFFIEMKKQRIFWGFCSVIGLIALLIAAERSTLPALLAGLFALYLTSHGMIKTRIRITAAVIVFAVLIVVTTAGDPFSSKEIKKYMPIGSITERFQKKDVSGRFAMQAAGLDVALKNPLGLFAQNVREEHWGRVAADEGYKFPSDRRGEYELVHNGYIRIIILLGWITVPLMAYVIFSIFRRIKHFGSCMTGGDVKIRRYGAAAGSCLIALLVQPLAHNDSLFFIEKTTWIFFILLLVWHYHIRNELKNSALKEASNEEC